MAKGQPNMGFRRAMSNGLLQPNPIIDPADIIKQTPQHLDQNETEDEIEERLSERFLVMNTMTKACALGEVPAFIMSGPPGVGKTYETSSVLSWTERKHKIKTIFPGLLGLQDSIRSFILTGSTNKSWSLMMLIPSLWMMFHSTF